MNKNLLNNQNYVIGISKKRNLLNKRIIAEKLTLVGKITFSFKWLILFLIIFPFLIIFYGADGWSICIQLFVIIISFNSIILSLSMVFIPVYAYIQVYVYHILENKFFIIYTPIQDKGKIYLKKNILNYK